MASLNKVFLIGNLTRDPDLRHTTSGAAVCSFGMAVNRRFTTSRGEEREEVCFIDIEAWGRWAEACKNYLRKGAPVLIEGRLRYDQWEDRETGKSRSRLLVTVERGQFLGQPSRGSDYAASDGERGAGSDRQRTPPPPGSGPAPDAAQAQAPVAQEARPAPPPFEPVDSGDDDIPF